LTSTKSAEPEFRTDPVGEATDRSITLGRGAGEELEHVLHLRHYLKRHIHARLACEIRQLAAVVEQRLNSPRLDIDRWETFEVGMQRIGQRVLAIAASPSNAPAIVWMMSRVTPVRSVGSSPSI